MQQLSDWFFSIIFFSGILGITISAILFFVNKTDSFSSKLLAGFLTTFSLLALNYALIMKSFFLQYPHLWRAFGWASFSFAPFGYLYVRSVLTQSYRFRRRDFLWFVPALLHIVNSIPFFILPTYEKIDFLNRVAADKKLIINEAEGILPAGWTAWGRVALGLICTIGQILLLIRFKKKILDVKNPLPQNIFTYKWLVFFTATMIIFWISIVSEFVFHFIQELEINYIIVFTIGGTILFISLALLFRPAILYGLTGWRQQAILPNPVPNNVSADSPLPITKKTYLSAEQGLAFKTALETHFKTNQPYRKNGYTISHLSNELNIPTHQLSAFINQEYAKNFNEFINESRVEYLEKLLEKSPEFFQFTLEALGKQAGFNTRAAFIAAVKKKTGKTPSEFFYNDTKK